MDVYVGRRLNHTAYFIRVAYKAPPEQYLFDGHAYRVAYIWRTHPGIEQARATAEELAHQLRLALREFIDAEGWIHCSLDAIVASSELCDGAFLSRFHTPLIHIPQEC